MRRLLKRKSTTGLSRNQKAFTLLELMIAVAIVGVIASIAMPAFSKYVKEARRSEAVRMLLESIRAQQEVPTQWAIRGDASTLMNPEASSSEFCQNLQFTEFFHSSMAGVPTLAVRFPNAKYNLILGITSKSCWEESVQQAGITELAQLPGYEYLPPKSNDFGSDSSGNNFLVGAERRADNGQLDVLFINQDGNLFLLCDEGNEVASARDLYLGVTDGAPTCVVSTADTEDEESGTSGLSL